MKLHNRTLEYLYTSNILKTIYENNLPVVESFRLLNLVKKLEDISIVYIIERNKLISKYAKDVKGKFIIENMDNFEKEFESLLDEKIEININRPKINILNLTNLSIYPRELKVLSEIIEFYEGENNV